MQTQFERLLLSGAKSFIRNSHLRTCMSCKFLDITTYTHCLRFGVKNKVTGSITFDDAESCRNDKHKCAESAIFYINKDDHAKD